MILVTPGNYGHERMFTQEEVGTDRTELNIPEVCPPQVVFTACLSECCGYSLRACTLPKHPITYL